MRKDGYWEGMCQGLPSPEAIPLHRSGGHAWRPYTLKEDKLIAKLVVERHGRDLIAEALNRSPYAIVTRTRSLARMGVLVNAGFHQWNWSLAEGGTERLEAHHARLDAVHQRKAAVLEQVAEWFQDAVPVAEMARRLGCHRRTVERRLEELRDDGEIGFAIVRWDEDELAALAEGTTKKLRRSRHAAATKRYDLRRRGCPEQVKPCIPWTEEETEALTAGEVATLNRSRAAIKCKRRRLRRAGR